KKTFELIDKLPWPTLYGVAVDMYGLNGLRTTRSPSISTVPPPSARRTPVTSSFPWWKPVVDRWKVSAAGPFETRLRAAISIGLIPVEKDGLTLRSTTDTRPARTFSDAIRTCGGGAGLAGGAAGGALALVSFRGEIRGSTIPSGVRISVTH